MRGNYGRQTERQRKKDGRGGVTQDGGGGGEGRGKGVTWKEDLEGREWGK